MKKILTLCFALGMFAMVQAQPGNRDNRRNDQRNDQPNDQRDFNNDRNNNRDVVIYDDGFDRNRRFDNNDRFDDRFSSDRRRDLEIAKINREYDYKIQRVQCSFYMSRWEKQRQIRFLEQQRQQEIRMIYSRYDDHRGRRHDRYDHYERHW